MRQAPVPPFQDLVEANRATVYRFLTVAVGPVDADDCFQETFLAALRAYPRLKRRRPARPVGPEDRLAEGDRPPPSHGRGARSRATTLPERATHDDEPSTDDPLWAAVRALPPKQRVAVVHRHVLDRSYADIAELMDSSEETARANVHQGTKRLRELMA